MPPLCIPKDDGRTFILGSVRLPAFLGTPGIVETKKPCARVVAKAQCSIVSIPNERWKLTWSKGRPTPQPRQISGQTGTTCDMRCRTPTNLAPCHGRGRGALAWAWTKRCGGGERRGEVAGEPSLGVAPAQGPHLLMGTLPTGYPTAATTTW